MTNLITQDNFKNIIDDINNSFYDIPFGNTEFQTRMFVIAAQITPERMYRQLGLSLMSLLDGLQEKIYAREEQIIEVEELEEIINNENSNSFEIRKAQIKLKRIENSLASQKKSMNDLLCEANIYYEYLKKFPKYTREQFENGEKTYFEQSLRRKAIGIIGEKEALVNMVDDKQTLINLEKAFAELPKNISNEELKELSLNSLAGLIKINEK